MDIFGVKALKAQNQQLASAVRGLQSMNLQSAVANIRTMIFPNWESVREIDAYIIFDDVYSIVSRLATSSAQVPFEAYDDITDEDLPPTDNLSIYLKQLTFEQKEELYLWLYLSGEVFMYKDAILLGPNKGKLKTYFLHPSFVTLILDPVFPHPIIGYRYQDTQTTFTLEANQVIYIKQGKNPTTLYDQRFRGLGAMKALAQRLTRLQANMSASVSQMQNGGVPSIVYDKTPGIDTNYGNSQASNNEATVMGQHKDNFSRFLRNSDNKGAPYFAAGEMGVIQLGLSLVEMDALVMADIDFDKICNAFSISSVLFNNKKSSTESNVKEMRKDMYTNAIIPNVKRVCDAITQGTKDIFGEGKCVRPETSEIPELQQDMKDKAQAWASLPAFVPNEMRESMGMDQSNDPQADLLYIKSGYTLLDDLNISVTPIDNTANDYGNNNTGNSQ